MGWSREEFWSSTPKEFELFLEGHKRRERFDLARTVIVANSMGAKLTVAKLTGEDLVEEEGPSIDVMLDGSADGMVERARARAARRNGRAEH